MMKERVALINRIRGSLSEYGIVIAQGREQSARELPGILEDAENELTAAARQLFSELYEDLGAREQRSDNLSTRSGPSVRSMTSCAPTDGTRHRVSIRDRPVWHRGGREALSKRSAAGGLDGLVPRHILQRR